MFERSYIQLLCDGDGIITTPNHATPRRFQAVEVNNDDIKATADLAMGHLLILEIRRQSPLTVRQLYQTADLNPAF